MYSCRKAQGTNILVVVRKDLGDSFIVLQPLSVKIPQRIVKLLAIRTDAVQATICHEEKELLAKENHQTNVFTLLEKGKCQLP